MNASERNKLDNLTEKVAVIDERQKSQAEDISEVKTGQNDMHEKLDRIFHHVVGDKEAGVKGIVEKLEIQEGRLTKLERIYLAVGLVSGLILSTQSLWLPLFK